MEYLQHFNPITLYEGVRDGTLADKVDKRIVSALVLYFGAKLAYKALVKPSCSFFKYFIRPQRNIYQRYGGGWAVITGASSGIGLGYAKTLARQGFNIFMISSNEARLKIAQAQVKLENPDVEVKIMEFNFNRPYTPEDYKPLYDTLDLLSDIAILVNNVGYGYHSDKVLHLRDDALVTSEFQLNIVPMIYMTKHCLGLMLERKDKKSAIISISSIASIFFSGSSTMYCCTKAFIVNFMNTLSQAPQYKNIDILALQTASVESNMNRGKMPMTVSPEEYSEKSLKHLGYESLAFGHWKHGLLMHMAYNPITIPYVIYSMIGVSLGSFFFII